MEKICYIIGAGQFRNNFIKLNEDDILICSDGGYKTALKHHLKVDLLVGDFDSLKEIPQGINIVKLDKKKDETDLFVSIEEGIKLGYQTFKIYGATGKRIEHTIGNISILLNLKNKNLKGYLIDDYLVYEVLSNETKVFNQNNRGYFSVFSLTNESEISLINLVYELNNYKIKADFPLGIDNEFIKNKEASIKVSKGTVLIIYRDRNI